MNYRVRFATESMLNERGIAWPDGSPWVMCEETGETILWIHRRARDLPDAEMATVLEEAWEGYRAIIGDSIPRQRISA